MKILLLPFITLLILLPIELFADGSKAKRFKNAFDKNSDGFISLNEYVSTRAKWGKPEDESKKFFKYHDKNKDGKITLEEFLGSK